MKLITLFLALLLALTCWTKTYAQSGDVVRPGSVILSDDQSRYPLGLSLEILEDPSRELTIEDVTSPEYADQFLPSQVDVPNLGFSDSAFWVRVPLRNESQLTQWLLDVGWANLQYVDFYAPGQPGAGFTGIETGVFRPPGNRDTPYRRFIFDLSLPTQSEQTYYLRFQNGGSITLPLTVWQPEALASQVQKELLRDGMFFGVLFGLLIYNLFLFFSLRERNYLYLSFFLASFLFFEAVYSGYLEFFLIPNFYYLRPYYHPLSFALFNIMAILFSDSFLEAKSRLPRMHKAITAILLVWVFLLILVPFTSYAFLAPPMVSWALVSMLVIMAAGIVSWRRGFRPTRFFLFAWLGLLITIVVSLLVRLGAIPSTTWTEGVYHYGVMWMVVSWSIALADRINMLKVETETANRDLMHSERRLAQTLEAMPVGVVVYGPDQRPIYINARTAEILTNPDRDIRPHTDLERTLPEAMSYYSFRVSGSDLAYPLEKFPVYRALLGEPSYADDIEADLVDWRVPLEAWASPVFDDAGNVESAVIAFQDITTRKQAEEALRASEKKFRAVVENVFDGIAFLDRDRKILYVSPSYEQLNGLRAEELIGETGTETIHPDDQSYVAAAFQKLLQQPGGKVSEEYRIRHQDESWVWVETRAMNLLDDPYVQAVVLNSRDISERKQKDAELQAQRDRLEQLVLARTAMLNDINEQLTNEAAERTVLQDLLYKRIEWMSAVSLARQNVRGTAGLRSAYSELSESIQRLLNAGTVLLISWLNQDHSGDYFCHLVKGGLGRDVEGLKTSFSGVSALRQAIEQGNPRLYSSAEIALLPEPLQACLAEDSGKSFLLIPIRDGEAVSGALGLVVPQSVKSLDRAQDDLVSEIARDLARLNEYAIFVDQSRDLFAAEERSRLARDLHDSVTQVLFSASLVAEVLPKIWRSDPQKAEASLYELRRLTRGAMAEMRTMLLELRPAALTKSPLSELLAQLTEAITSRNALSFRLLIEKAPPLPEEVQVCYYRVAQEALNNIAKHARASTVTLMLKAELQTNPAGQESQYEVQLVVDDDGVGFDLEEEQSEHLGLGIMRERAADIQANLTIESQIGQGTRLTLIWCGTLQDS